MAGVTADLTFTPDELDLIAGAVPPNAPVMDGVLYDTDPAYGIVGDNVADDTVGLNALFADGFTQNKKVKLTRKTYRITDTLHVNRSFFDGRHYTSAFIQGNGSGYLGSMHQTKINATEVVDRPAMMISGGRAVYIGHINIEGPNSVPESYIGRYQDMRYDSEWVSEGLRDSRYSPQCGICIDGDQGAVPPDGGYPGTEYSGVSRGSHQIMLDRVTVQRNVVGVMHNPGLAQNGDDVFLHNCQILRNKVNIASGQSQANCITVSGGTLAVCRTMFDGFEYGQQQGRAPFFSGVQYNVSYEVINWNSGFNAAVFSGGRSERIHRIGFGGNYSTQKYGVYSFGTEWHLFGSDNLGPPSRCPVVYEGGDEPFVMYGGCLRSAGDVASGMNEALTISAGHSALYHTSVKLNNKFRPYISGPADLGKTVQLKNVRVFGYDGGGGVVYGAEDTRLGIGGRISETEAPSLRYVNDKVYHYKKQLVAEYNGNNYLSMGTMTNIVFTDNDVSFDNSRAEQYLVGDTLFWKMKPIGNSAGQGLIVHGLKVTGISGNRITCDYLYTRDYYDETWAPTSTRVAVHHWAPGQALTCDTDGTNVLSNVAPANILQDGDWVQGSAGLPALSRVVGGGGTDTVTLNNNATGTVNGVNLYFDRLHEIQTRAALQGPPGPPGQPAMTRDDFRDLYGFPGNTDDTQAIQNAVDQNAGRLTMPAGDYYTSEPISFTNRDRIWEGSGTATQIFNSTTDVVHVAGQNIRLRDIKLYAIGTSAGTTIKQVGTVAGATFENLILLCLNPATHVWDNGGFIYIDNWLKNTFIFGHPAHSVPLMTYKGAGSFVNHNSWEDLRFTNTGNYAVRIDAEDTSCYQNNFNRINFEGCNGGGIELLGCYASSIKNCFAYDFTGPISRNFYSLGSSSAASNISCKYVSIENCGRAGGTLATGVSDVKLNSASRTLIVGGMSPAGSQFTIDENLQPKVTRLNSDCPVINRSPGELSLQGT